MSEREEADSMRRSGSSFVETPSVPSQVASPLRLQDDNPMRGIFLMVMGLMLVDFHDALLKLLTHQFPETQLIFLRSIVSTFVMLPLALHRVPRGGWRLHRPGAWVVRIVAGTMASVGFVVAVKYMPLAEVVAIAFISPFLITLAGKLFLNEQVGWRRMVATVVGFSGVLLIVRPGSEVFNIGSLWALMAAVGWVMTSLTTRVLTASHHVLVTTVVPLVIITSLMGLVAVFDWHPIARWDQIGVILAMGVTGAIGFWMVAEAHAIAPASTLAPFQYTEIPFVTFLGFMIFGDIPGLWTWAGIAVVVSSGLYIWWRERQRLPV